MALGHRMFLVCHVPPLQQRTFAFKTFPCRIRTKFIPLFASVVDKTIFYIAFIATTIPPLEIDVVSCIVEMT